MSTYAARQLNLTQVHDSFATLRGGALLGLLGYAYVWGSRPSGLIDTAAIQRAAHVVIGAASAAVACWSWTRWVYTAQGGIRSRWAGWACVLLSSLCVVALGPLLLPPWRVSAELGAIALSWGSALLFTAMATLVLSADALSAPLDAAAGAGVVAPVPAAPKRARGRK